MYVCTCVCTLFTHLLYASQCVWRLSPCPCPFQHLCQSQSCDIPWRLMHPHSFACWCFHAHTHRHKQAGTHTHTHRHTNTGFGCSLFHWFELLFFFNAFVTCLELDAGAGLTGRRCRHLSLLKLCLLLTSSPLYGCNFSELQLLTLTNSVVVAVDWNCKCKSISQSLKQKEYGNPQSTL